MLNSQKSAISAALPPELSRALGASGLLAGLGAAAAGATQTAASAVSGAATAASSTASSAASSAARSAESAARSAQTAASRIPTPPAPTSSCFPMWAIILIVIVVLLAIWWFMTHNEKPAEPAKTGLLSAPVEYALRAAPAPAVPLLD
jgi:cobalamin biosynthesis Mg chelatase CobN